MNGPGELTLTSIVLFTLGAYGIAAGAASGEQTVVAVGVFAFVLFLVGIIWPIVALSGVELAAWTPADAVAGEIHDVHVRLYGRVTRVEMRVLDPPGDWWVTAAPAVLAHRIVLTHGIDVRGGWLAVAEIVGAVESPLP